MSIDILLKLKNREGCECLDLNEPCKHSDLIEEAILEIETLREKLNNKFVYDEGKELIAFKERIKHLLDENAIVATYQQNEMWTGWRLRAIAEESK